MNPQHVRLAILLQEAAAERGGQAALARALGFDPKEVSNLIHGRRFVTVKQALKIEALLGVSAEELWVESCVARGHAAFAKAKKK
jgi:plasmid maintenance system antidote protein VapI